MAEVCLVFGQRSYYITEAARFGYGITFRCNMNDLHEID
jgi:hypothetical protein